VKLVGESTQFPREHIGVYASSLTPIPPRLLYQRRHIRGSQLKVTDFSSYRGKHILVMTGTADADHPRKLDEAIVEWLNQNGANADFIYLGDRGIVGNGHIMMLEKNSDALSEQVVSWITAPSRKGSAPFSTAAPYKSHLPPRRRATRADRRQTRPCPPCARQSSNSSLDPPQRCPHCRKWICSDHRRE
jgi:hypothetical protein